MYICICVYMYICICVYIYMYICIYVLMYICIYVYMCICVCTNTYVCIYICICEYVYGPVSRVHGQPPPSNMGALMLDLTNNGRCITGYGSRSWKSSCR